MESVDLISSQQQRQEAFLGTVPKSLPDVAERRKPGVLKIWRFQRMGLGKFCSVVSGCVSQRSCGSI
jgi:hypothetical protein